MADNHDLGIISQSMDRSAAVFLPREGVVVYPTSSTPPKSSGAIEQHSDGLLVVNLTRQSYQHMAFSQRCMCLQHETIVCLLELS